MALKSVLNSLVGEPARVVITIVLVTSADRPQRLFPAHAHAPLASREYAATERSKGGVCLRVQYTDKNLPGIRAGKLQKGGERRCRKPA